jgi:hypothetical protein
LKPLRNADLSVLLVIDNGGRLPPTSRSLLQILLRMPQSAEQLRFIVLDPDAKSFYPSAAAVVFPCYDGIDFAQNLSLCDVSPHQRMQIYALNAI